MKNMRAIFTYLLVMTIAALGFSEPEDTVVEESKTSSEVEQPISSPEQISINVVDLRDMDFNAVLNSALFYDPDKVEIIVMGVENPQDPLFQMVLQTMRERAFHDGVPVGRLLIANFIDLDENGKKTVVRGVAVTVSEHVISTGKDDEIINSKYDLETRLLTGKESIKRRNGNTQTVSP